MDAAFVLQPAQPRVIDEARDQRDVRRNLGRSVCFFLHQNEFGPFGMGFPKRQHVFCPLERAAACEMEKTVPVLFHGAVETVLRRETQIGDGQGKRGKDRLGVTGLGKHLVDVSQSPEMPARKPLLVRNEPVLPRCRKPARKHPLDVDDVSGALAPEKPLGEAALPCFRKSAGAAGTGNRGGEDFSVACQTVIVGTGDQQPVNHSYPLHGE